MFGNLSLITKDTLMILTGNFQYTIPGFQRYRTYSGEVYLQKTARPVASNAVVTLDEIKRSYHLSFVTPVKKTNC
jgi:hypothetical protein